MFMQGKVWLWKQQLELAQKQSSQRNELVTEILQDVLDTKSKVKLNQTNLFVEGVGIAYTAVAKLNPNADPE